MDLWFLKTLIARCLRSWKLNLGVHWYQTLILDQEGSWIIWPALRCWKPQLWFMTLVQYLCWLLTWLEILVYCLTLNFDLVATLVRSLLWLVRGMLTFIFHCMLLLVSVDISHFIYWFSWSSSVGPSIMPFSFIVLIVCQASVYSQLV